MSINRVILAAGVALTASSLAAQSADLYGAHGGRGSIKDDGYNYAAAAPRGCPTYYARVDGGYSTFDRPALTQVGIDDLINARVKDTGNIGGGIGLYFTCNIRGDITVDHRFKSDMTGFNGNNAAPNFGMMKWGYESTAIMSNMYYDFNAGARFTPYIGFGFGSVQNTFERGKGVVAPGANVAANVGLGTTVGGSNSWHVAGAAMTGFVFNVSDRLKLDTGYRFMYLGATKTGQTSLNGTAAVGGVIHADSLHAHEIRIGLRYDIR